MRGNKPHLRWDKDLHLGAKPGAWRYADWRGREGQGRTREDAYAAYMCIFTHGVQPPSMSGQSVQYATDLKMDFK